MSRWSNERMASEVQAIDAARIEAARREADGIFRVWSTEIPEPQADGSYTDRVLWNENYPLTEYAEEVQAGWDPVADNPFLFCENGMPVV